MENIKLEEIKYFSEKIKELELVRYAVQSFTLSVNEQNKELLAPLQCGDIKSFSFSDKDNEDNIYYFDAKCVEINHYVDRAPTYHFIGVKGPLIS